MLLMAMMNSFKDYLFERFLRPWGDNDALTQLRRACLFTTLTLSTESEDALKYTSLLCKFDSAVT